MLEFIAVGYLLSVLTIVMLRGGDNFGMLDPDGVKTVSIYMLAVLLSIINVVILFGD